MGRNPRVRMDRFIRDKFHNLFEERELEIIDELFEILPEIPVQELFSDVRFLVEAYSVTNKSHSQKLLMRSLLAHNHVLERRADEMEKWEASSGSSGPIKMLQLAWKVHHMFSTSLVRRIAFLMGKDEKSLLPKHEMELHAENFEIQRKRIERIVVHQHTEWMEATVNGFCQSVLKSGMLVPMVIADGKLKIAKDTMNCPISKKSSASSFIPSLISPCLFSHLFELSREIVSHFNGSVLQVFVRSLKESISRKLFPGMPSKPPLDEKCSGIEVEIQESGAADRTLSLSEQVFLQIMFDLHVLRGVFCFGERGPLEDRNAFEFTVSSILDGIDPINWALAEHELGEFVKKQLEHVSISLGILRPDTSLHDWYQSMDHHSTGGEETKDLKDGFLEMYEEKSSFSLFPIGHSYSEFLQGGGGGSGGGSVNPETYSSTQTANGKKMSFIQQPLSFVGSVRSRLMKREESAAEETRTASSSSTGTTTTASGPSTWFSFLHFILTIGGMKTM
eukprot:TRINITY_DN24756_c0_g1_i2.p1 TRINITY_DN24756_c0_g1~~TRINITY_DN24756_c0_g1_i2.p1  ORF type:complete len:506 (+),score=150.60 TRINITY_DN24756_c0_g1_i2:1234-2751(+)